MSEVSLMNLCIDSPSLDICNILQPHNDIAWFAFSELIGSLSRRNMLLELQNYFKTLKYIFLRKDRDIWQQH